MTDRIKNKVWIGAEEEDFDLKYIRENKPRSKEIIDLCLRVAVSKERIVDIMKKKDKDKEIYVKEYKELQNFIENATFMIEYMEKKENEEIQKDEANILLESMCQNLEKDNEIPSDDFLGRYSLEYTR